MRIMTSLVRSSVWLFFICHASVLPAQFSGGSGTAEDPYQVSTLEQLQEICYQIGEGCYSAFRVPALVVSNDGTLIAVAEARYATWRDDRAEDDIVVKRSDDGGRTWGLMIIAASDGQNTLNDPVPVVLPSGRILIMYNWNEPVDKSKRRTREIHLIYSDDDGRTWSEPRDITPMVYKNRWGWYGTGPGHGIVLEKEPYRGRIIIPAMHNPADARATSHILYSDDNGKTWHIGAITPGERRGESTAVELSNGHVMLNSRDHNDEVGGPPYRFVAISDDGGESFYISYYDSTLIEPAAMGSILKHSVNENTGKYNILFSNPHSSERGVRVCGTLKLSEDDGATWSRMKRYSDPYPRFSGYSDIAVINEEGDIGVMFETGPHYDNPVRWDGIVFRRVKSDDINTPIDDPQYCSQDEQDVEDEGRDYVFVFDARNGHYVQTADIDASETENWNTGLGFEPIGGFRDNTFTGSYDGNGYKIENLTINRPDESQVGLFGIAGGREIKNVALENVDISGNNKTGGLVGELRSGQIIHSYVTGNVRGDRAVGGLAGTSKGTDASKISESYADVEVSGREDIGGLVGQNMQEAKITSSYAAGKVSGGKHTGGLVGRNSLNATVSTSYSVGTVSVELEGLGGGCIGMNEGGEIHNSYWDMETSGFTMESSVNGMMGLRTKQMTGHSAMGYMTGFDFENIWQVTDGYPLLFWEEVGEHSRFRK